MSYRLPRAQRLMIVCGGVLLGLAVRFFWEAGRGEWWYGLACLGVVFAVLGRRAAWLLGGGLLILGLTIGYVRMDSALTLPGNDQLSRYNDSHQQIIVRGVIAQEPEQRIGDQRLVLAVDEVTHEGKAARSVQGRVLVKLSLFPEYSYGEGMTLQCELETPFETSDFSYKRYLALKQIYSICARPVVLHHGDSPVRNNFEEGMLVIKNYLLSVIHHGLAEPQASLLAGLLIGQGSGFPPLLKKDFATTGLTHIIAISGYNITIIVVFIYGLLSRLRLSRISAFWITSIAISVFAVFTGGQAATIRAAVMGVLALTAGVVGRPSAVWSLILVSAVAMALVNPLVLISDVGFQLSFLATIGLVVWTPLIQGYGARWRSRTSWHSGLFGSGWELFAQTMGAIIMTLPLMLAQFGTLSIIAPLSNLLILPSIPFAMAVGAGWLGVAVMMTFLGVSGGVVSGILAGPAWLILSYISRMTTALAAVPLASITVPLGAWRWLVMSGLYVVTALAYWFMKKRAGDTTRKTC